MDAHSYQNDPAVSPAISAKNLAIRAKAYTEYHTAQHVERVMRKMESMGAVFEPIEGHPLWYRTTYTLPGDDQPTRYNTCAADSDDFDRLFALAIRAKLAA